MEEDQIDEVLQRRIYDLIGTLVDTKLIAKKTFKPLNNYKKKDMTKKSKMNNCRKEI